MISRRIQSHTVSYECATKKLSQSKQYKTTQSVEHLAVSRTSLFEVVHAIVAVEYQIPCIVLCRYPVDQL